MKPIDLTKLSIEQVKKLNVISETIIEDFNLFSGDLLKLYPDKPSWLFHPVNSRSLHQSNFFLDLCLIELLRTELSNKHNYKQIVVSKKAMARTLIENETVLNTGGLKIVVNSSKISPKENLKFIKNAYKLLRMYLSKNKKRRQDIVNKPICLIDTFILQNSVTAEKYVDRYYNGILENLPTELNGRIYFLPTFIPIHKPRVLDNIYKNSDVNLIFHTDFLQLSDYFSALVSPKITSLKRVKKNQFVFRGIDMVHLINLEIKGKSNDYMVIRALLNYKLFKRLKTNNIDIGIVIDWFENQCVDKAISLGVKKYYPSTSIKGYQGYIISTKFNFYIQPTVDECNLQLIPDEILVPGKALVEEMKKFNPKLRVIPAPAFRFKSVWELANNHIAVSEKKILIALPVGQKELREILNLVFDTIENNASLANFIFEVKAHPSTKIHDIKSEYGEHWPENIGIVEGDFTKILLSSSLLISNSSSVCIEALTFAKPVIIVGSQSTITQNPISSHISEKIYAEVYTSADLSKAILKLIDFAKNNQHELVEISNEVREQYFEKIDKEKVIQIFSK